MYKGTLCGANLKYIIQKKFTDDNDSFICLTREMNISAWYLH